jgi:hypothetical protein
MEGEWRASRGLSAGTLNIKPLPITTPFNSITNLSNWLITTSTRNNAPAIAYTVKLNVSDLGGSPDTFNNSLGAILLAHPDKYIDLDLSGSTMTNIPNYAFSTYNFDTFTRDGCAITGITIPNTVISIGEGAFFGCKYLTSVTIGSGVNSIGKDAFSGCTDLASIEVPDANTAYSFEDGVLYNKDKTTLVMCLTRKTGAFSIPNSVTSIGNGAFTDCISITGVTIPDGITSIGNNVFIGCTSLASVTIPDGITSIGNTAFTRCTSLASITIPDSVESIGDGAFMGCTGLTSVTIPNNVESIGGMAFLMTNLTSVTFEGTIPSSGFPNDYPPFPGDLRAKFYATDATNGTPGTYTRPNGTSETWTKK